MDAFARGLDYLYNARSLALDADMVDLVFDHPVRSPICSWIGEQIDQVNAVLQQYLQACHDCFHPSDQRTIRILAAPIASRFGIDGMCNLETAPMTILVDVGRVIPQDWMALVMHEYAHAHAGTPGHHLDYARSLSHLCLGLAIAPPPLQEDQLRVYPPYHSLPDPLEFWKGRVDWQSSVTDYYSFHKRIG